MVLRGIGRLDMGLATIGGLGIVILAIVLDRITQAMANRERKRGRWYESGPLGALMAPQAPRARCRRHENGTWPRLSAASNRITIEGTDP